MKSTLEGPRRDPLSGEDAKQLVVLLHGYGADGDDLIGLADAWSPFLPEAAFIAPHGPFPCGGAPFGREWFPLEKRDLASIAGGIAMAAPILDAFLDTELREHDLTADALVIMGFSQGAMMALDIGPARPKPIAGIMSYSGLIARPLRPAHPGVPPVFLFHGTEDAMIPAGALERASGILEMAGLPVEQHLRPGLGHGIDQAGLALGAAFLARVLNVVKET